MNQPTQNKTVEGILLVNKPKGMTSFGLVSLLRRRLGVKKIGHAGTLDPNATGVMVMLIGRQFTRLSDTLLTSDKEYIGEVHLGIKTDTYDNEGTVLERSELQPTLAELQEVLTKFQGEIDQVPPMYSAKKINGKKLYDLARKGLEIERKAVKVHLETELISYQYPFIKLRVKCSKGTYIRSIAHEIGELLGCGAHLSNLLRTRSGSFLLENCIDGEKIKAPDVNLEERLITPLVA